MASLINSGSVKAIPFTLQRADKYVIMTAAEEDNPPVGRLPAISPRIPTDNGYFLERVWIAPTKKSPQYIFLSGKSKREHSTVFG